MPTATFAHPPSTTPGLGMAPPVKVQLRRAVYVHVSDLLSAYNIDHSKLEEELHRVKAHRDAEPLGVPTELDTNSNPKKLQPPRGGFNLCVYVCVMACMWEET